jgi:hypothetical protein
MSIERFGVKGKGFSLDFILKSGGIRVFVWFDLAIGIVCVIFAWIKPSLMLIPLGFWAFVTYKIFAFLVKMANSKKGRALFLDTHYLYKLIAFQMSYTGDKHVGRVRIEEGSQVQPLRAGDIVPETRIERRQQ